MRYYQKYFNIKIFIYTAILLITGFGLKAQSFKEMVIDSTDNAVDISGLLNSDISFLPVPIIITEPAVGIGGGLVVVLPSLRWAF